MEQRWVVIAKNADFKGIGARFGIDQVTARVIHNRGIVGDEAIDEFFRGKLGGLPDPHLLKDGDRAAELLEEKLLSGASIRIIGDYDIDGVMSTYILKKALTKIADEKQLNAKISYGIPHRIYDGYGLNQSLIEQAREDGIDTIITCDNGISALEEIALAKRYGMTVVVTDHHEVPFRAEKDGMRRELRSEADAVVNPHQAGCAYPFKDLCGAGVAWKLIVLLYERMGIPPGETEDFLENVAFATVGDIMPLIGENRILVREGLRRIHRTVNPGMRALIDRCGLRPEQIGTYHFGYVLGPCINASGRLDSARLALELFFADAGEAVRLADKLARLNEERKRLTEDGVAAAVSKYEAGGYDKDPVIVLYLPQLHESVAGIVAGRIRERYYKPTFILTDSEGNVKGSGRSVEEYSMYEEMSRCGELFLKYGGHPAAAGLSLPREHVELFRRRINELCPPECRGLAEKVRIDVPVPLGYLSEELVEELELLAPFGNGNPRPLFADRNLEVLSIKSIGKNKSGFKLYLKGLGERTVEAICFRPSELEEYLSAKFGRLELQKAMHGMTNGIRLAVAYRPQINEYRGVKRLQISIENYK